MAQMKVITRNGTDSPYPEKYRDRYAVEDVVGYILQDAKTCGSVGGWGVDVRRAAWEMERVAALWHKQEGVRIRHWVLTFSREELERLEKRTGLPARQVLQELGWRCAGFYAGRYQIVFGVHLDEPPFHLHFAMNTVSYVDGKKYAGTKGELYAYEQALKEILGRYGLPLYHVADRAEAKRPFRGYR